MYFVYVDILHISCRGFSWFLDTVYPELFRPDQALLSGKLVIGPNIKQNGGNAKNAQEGSDGCLVARMRRRKRQTPEMHKDCQRALPWHLTLEGEVQLHHMLLLRTIKQVRRDDSCLDWTGQELLVMTCHGHKGNQQWSFSNSTLLHRYSTEIDIKICQNICIYMF